MKVLLQPDKEELQRRTKAREAQGGHFMPSSLLESQLAALEPDSSAMVYRECTHPIGQRYVIKHRQAFDQLWPSDPSSLFAYDAVPIYV